MWQVLKELQMPSSVRITGQVDGLERILKNVSTNLVAKIGIFGGGNQRDDGSQTNAQIGAKHEFGSFSENLPRRSFLKDPITLKRKELLKKADKIIKANIDKPEGAEKIFELVGIVGEGIVQEAFETGGFGTWQSLSQRTIDKKGSSQILIDSSQLRKAIISKAEKR